jgi:hypothetical protein
MIDGCAMQGTMQDLQSYTWKLQNICMMLTQHSFHFSAFRHKKYGITGIGNIKWQEINKTQTYVRH